MKHDLVKVEVLVDLDLCASLFLSAAANNLCCSGLTQIVPHSCFVCFFFSCGLAS